MLKKGLAKNILQGRICETCGWFGDSWKGDAELLRCQFWGKDYRQPLNPKTCEHWTKENDKN